MRELSERAFVTLDQESNMHRILTNACLASGFHPNIVAYCNDIECYDKLVAMGMGIGIGKEDILGSEEICDLNVTDFQEHYTVFVYYRESDYVGSIKKLIDFIKESVAGF